MFTIPDSFTLKGPNLTVHFDGTVHDEYDLFRKHTYSVFLGDEEGAIETSAKVIQARSYVMGSNEALSSWDTPRIELSCFDLSYGEVSPEQHGMIICAIMTLHRHRFSEV